MTLQHCPAPERGRFKEYGNENNNAPDGRTAVQPDVQQAERQVRPQRRGAGRVSGFVWQDASRKASRRSEAHLTHQGIQGSIMSFNAQSKVWNIELKSTAKLVLLCLAEHADDVTLEAFPAITRIVQRT